MVEAHGRGERECKTHHINNVVETKIETIP